MTNRRYTAEVTDPITQEETVLTAASPQELEQRIDDFLNTRYPAKSTMPQLPSATKLKTCSKQPAHSSTK